MLRRVFDFPPKFSFWFSLLWLLIARGVTQWWKLGSYPHGLVLLQLSINFFQRPIFIFLSFPNPEIIISCILFYYWKQIPFSLSFSRNIIHKFSYSLFFSLSLKVTAISYNTRNSTILKNKWNIGTKYVYFIYHYFHHYCYCNNLQYMHRLNNSYRAGSIQLHTIFQMVQFTFLEALNTTQQVVLQLNLPHQYSPCI